MPKISAIIVALNEELFIERIISELRKQDYSGEAEILLADGGSSDRTIALARAQNVEVVDSPQKGKAYQMNVAAKKATGDVLFFVHADMQFPSTLFSAIAKTIDSGYSGGGFANEFDSHNKRIKHLGTLMNFRFFDKREQSDKGVFYGDNGIFVLKDVFDELDGFKEIPIMEDYDLSKRLSEKHRCFKIKDPKIVVSARRHIKEGFFKTRLQWVLIRKLFQWGISPYLLAKWYKDVR